MKKSIAICLAALAWFISLPASANLVTVTNTNGDSQGLVVISGTAGGLGNAPAFPADERISSGYDVLTSGTQNLIFELGEAWAFVIHDYANLFGPAPLLFGSIASDSTGDTVSLCGIIT